MITPTSGKRNIVYQGRCTYLNCAIKKRSPQQAYC